MLQANSIFAKVRNSDAGRGGLTTSLFRLLSEAHPEAVVNLEHQYRMNKDIMLLSNALIYDHKLRCGTTLVAESSLQIPNFDGLRDLHLSSGLPRGNEGNVSCVGTGCWLRMLLEPRYVYGADPSKCVILIVKV